MKKLFAIFIILQLVFVGLMFLAPDFVSAAGEDEVASTTEITNPLGFVGVGDPDDLVTRGFQGFAGIISFVAIAFAVFNGFKLTTATNDESREVAKQGLVWSIGGLAVALLSFTLVSGALNILGFDAGKITVGGDVLNNPITVAPGDAPFDTEARASRDFIQVLFAVMRNFLALIGSVTVALLVYNGIQYINSAGNEEKIEKVKTNLKWALIGFVVTVAAFIIISMVRIRLLGLDQLV